jgi:hypothetical protein
MSENDIIEEKKNIILNISTDNNDLSFSRLVKLQELVKKESVLRELCKKI